MTTDSQSLVVTFISCEHWCLRGCVSCVLFVNAAFPWGLKLHHNHSTFLFTLLCSLRIYGSVTNVLCKGSSLDLFTPAWHLEKVPEDDERLTPVKLFVVYSVFMPCVLCTWISNQRKSSSQTRAMSSPLNSIGHMMSEKKASRTALFLHNTPIHGTWDGSRGSDVMRWARSGRYSMR